MPRSRRPTQGSRKINLPRNVEAILLLEFSEDRAADAAKRISKNGHVDHVYVLADGGRLAVKVTLPDYRALRSFILKDVVALTGLEDTTTMLVLANVKEGAGLARPSVGGRGSGKGGAGVETPDRPPPVGGVGKRARGRGTSGRK